MSYTIVVSAQQLRVIRAALEVCPALDDKDEFGDNVQTTLVKLCERTLEFPEDNKTIHGWNIHGWIV